MRFPGFIGPSYQLASRNVDAQQCLGLYPELDELGSGKEREIAWLAPTPGLRRLVDLGTGGIRGSWYSSKGELFVVRRDKLYKVSSTWVGTIVGTLNTTSGPVSIADNGLQLVVVDGTTNCYVWDFSLLTFVVTPLPSIGTFGAGASQVVLQDGYFIFLLPNSQVFFISGLNEVTFDEADASSSEGNPDNLVAILSDHRNLWLFNKRTTEIYYDSGNTDFPFERMQGAYIETGCAAAFSVAKANGTVFWLGQDDKGSGMVYMAAGLQPVRISTHAIENAIKGYGDISNATAYCYQDGGHTFYVLNFPTPSRTWVFDATTKLWHERSYTINGQQKRHRADNHTFAFGTHVVGDWENGILYALDSNVMDDDGAYIMRRRRSPHVSDSLARIFHSSFQLDCESGTGLDGTQQGTDPQVMLRFSDDGGHTFSNEKWTSLGKIGQKKTRPIWRRLGVSRDRIYEITITDPVKVALIGAELMLEKGIS